MFVPGVEDPVSQVDEDTAHHQSEEDGNQNICCDHVFERHVEGNEDSQQTEPHKVGDDDVLSHVESMSHLRKSFDFS